MLVSYPTFQNLLATSATFQASVAAATSFQDLLLNSAELRQVLVQIPAIQKILLADPTVENLIFNDPAVLQELFAQPAVLQLLQSNPTILGTFFQNTAVQTQFLSEVGSQIFSSPVVLQAFFLTNPDQLDSFLAAKIRSCSTSSFAERPGDDRRLEGERQSGQPRLLVQRPASRAQRPVHRERHARR